MARGYQSYAGARLAGSQEFREIERLNREQFARDRVRHLEQADKWVASLRDVWYWRGKTVEDMTPDFDRVNAIYEKYQLPPIPVQDPRNRAVGELMKTVLPEVRKGALPPEAVLGLMKGAVGGDEDWLVGQDLDLYFGEQAAAREAEAAREEDAKAAPAGAEGEGPRPGAMGSGIQGPTPVRALGEGPAIGEEAEAARKTWRDRILEQLRAVAIPRPSPTDARLIADRRLKGIAAYGQGPNPDPVVVEVMIVDTMGDAALSGITLTREEIEASLVRHTNWQKLVAWLPDELRVKPDGTPIEHPRDLPAGFTRDVGEYIWTFGVTPEVAMEQVRKDRAEVSAAGKEAARAGEAAERIRMGWENLGIRFEELGLSKETSRRANEAADRAVDAIVRNDLKDIDKSIAAIELLKVGIDAWKPPVLYGDEADKATQAAFRKRQTQMRANYDALLDPLYESRDSLVAAEDVAAAAGGAGTGGTPSHKQAMADLAKLGIR